MRFLVRPLREVNEPATRILPSGSTSRQLTVELAEALKLVSAEPSVLMRPRGLWAEPLAFRRQSAPEPPKPSPAARIFPSVCTAKALMKLAVTPGVNPLSNEPSGLKRVMAPLDCPPAEGPAPTRIFLSGWTVIVLN